MAASRPLQPRELRRDRRPRRATTIAARKGAGDRLPKEAREFRMA